MAINAAYKFKFYIDYMLILLKWNEDKLEKEVKGLDEGHIKD